MNGGAPATSVEDVNRPTWSEVVDEYAIEGWSDPGELGALTFIADRVRGVPVLDLGMGGGRTGALLRLRAGDHEWIQAVKNWRRLRKEIRDEGEWGVAPFAAHQFGLLTHFITLRGAREELDAHGFDVDAVFECDSTQPHSPDEPVTAQYMHLVARRS